MYSQMMSRLRAPVRGRLKGQNALSKRPGRFERPDTRGLDNSGSLEAEADSSASGDAPERARHRTGLTGLTGGDPPGLAAEGHGLAGDTPVLMADGSTRTLAELKGGDAIMGTVREGGQQRHVKTQVLVRWSVIQPAFRIRLEDGTELVAGGGQRLLTTGGWKRVSAGLDGAASLKAGDTLAGTGAFAQAPDEDLDYRRGYLCGLLRGYASSEARPHSRGRVRISQRDPAPLIPCSGEAWQRAERYLRQWRPESPRVPLARAASGGERTPSFRVPLVRPLREEITEAIAWPAAATRSWSLGFLAGIFDAAGSYEGGALRICHCDPAVIGRAGAALRLLNIERRLEISPQRGRSPIVAVRIEGGLAEHLRFFQACNPANSARRGIAGQPVSSAPRLAVVAIEPLKGGRRLYDITTGTGDFIANGVVSHNRDAGRAKTGAAAGRARSRRRAKEPAVG